VTVRWAKLTSPGGAANANDGRGAGGETLLPDLPTADIAYFVYAGIDFLQCRVNRREMLAGLGGERRYVLPLEGDRRALRVMLVVTAGCPLARAGNDRGELPLKLRESLQRLVSIGGKTGLSGTRVSHLRHLSFKVTIPSAG
jgi:hypothetical protein